MSKLVWDKTGERFYETGVDHGVLYLQDSDGNYPKGVVWNGLTNVTDSPSGAEATAIYADNIKYLTLMSAEEYAATVEAYTYPDEFTECDGSAQPVKGLYLNQQDRRAFGMATRSLIGNDIEGNAHGYKINIIYNAKASPSEKAHQTVNDSPEAVTFSWDLTTNPININSIDPTTNKPYKPTANVVLDSRTIPKAKLEAIEDILYGTESEDARLPLPDEIIDILRNNSPSPSPINP